MATTDLGKDAFMNHNYLLACEIFEHCIKEKEKVYRNDSEQNGTSGRRLSQNSLEAYTGYADSLSKTGQLKEAFDVYGHISGQFHYGLIPLEKLKHLTNSIIEYALSKSRTNLSDCSIVDPLCCPICEDILRFPVTALCGHTYCRQCCFGHSQCIVCGQKFPTFSSLTSSSCSTTSATVTTSSFSSSTATVTSETNFEDHPASSAADCVIGFEQDILIRRLVERWWGPELRAAEYNEEAQRFLESSSLDDALRCCNQSLENAPNSFKGLLLRSETLHRLNHYQSALADADNALKSRPTSHKAFFQRALSLSRLGKVEEALTCHCISLALDRHSIGVSNGIRQEITKLLQSLLSMTSKYTPTAETLSSVFAHSLNHNRKRKHDMMSSHKPKTKRRILIRTASYEEEDHSNFGEEEFFPAHFFTTDHINDFCDKNKKHRKSLQAFSLNILKHHTEPQNIIPKINLRLRSFVDKLNQELEKIRLLSNSPRPTSEVQLHVNPLLVESSDFDCVLCCRTLYNPVVTPCGHTYCWVCLDRCMDYSSSCPLCMAPLIEQFRHHLHNSNNISLFSSPTLISLSKRQVSRFVEEAMIRFIPDTYDKRKRQELDREPSVPVFICTTAFPSVPCPLFVYEPRYRLMVRRAIESGERQFGIALPSSGRQRYVEYGTMLDIRDCVLLGDGCSILSTVGGRRFKVVGRHEKDGYDTANVEFIQDEKLYSSENEAKAGGDDKMHLIRELHEKVLCKAINWYESLPENIKCEIFKSLGKMPDLEDDWENIVDGPAWAWWIIAILPLGQPLKVGILGTTSLEKRLRAIDKTLNLEYLAAQKKQNRSICAVSTATSSCCDGLSPSQQCQAIDCCLREISS